MYNPSTLQTPVTLFKETSCRFGLHKTTLLDFPGQVAATLFLPGCNLRCPYCHNPEMVMPGKETRTELYDWEQIRTFIHSRRNLIGGVCISGGEPLLYAKLPDLIRFIHDAGLKVKLDTNGTFPERLQELDADYIAMDIKTAPEKYPRLGPGSDLAQKIRTSIEWIMHSGIPYEFRTTVVPGFVGNEDISIISSLIRGARLYVLSQFRPGITLDPVCNEILPYPSSTLQEFKEIAHSKGVNCRVRAGYRTDT